MRDVTNYINEGARYPTTKVSHPKRVLKGYDPTRKRVLKRVLIVVIMITIYNYTLPHCL